MLSSTRLWVLQFLSFVGKWTLGVDGYRPLSSDWGWPVRERDSSSSGSLRIVLCLVSVPQISGFPPLACENTVFLSRISFRL